MRQLSEWRSMLDKNDLCQKVIFISGGATGIGREVALQLLDRGASVILNYLVEQEALVEEMRSQVKNVGKLICYPGDIRDVSYVLKLKSDIRQIWGEIDACINNASILVPGLLQMTNSEQYEATMLNNLKANIKLTEALKSMIGYAGRIINISSCTTGKNIVGAYAYTVSKYALEGYTEALAMEMAAKKITVNAVAPGFTETPMLDFFLPSGRMKKKILTQIPLSHVADVKEIVPSIIYLLSEQARYITGQVVYVDGGFAI